jgi:undecaprenyl diphosphate synthase
VNDSAESSPLVPRHIAVVMDGNGRWAQQRDLPRTAGHRAGADAARRIIQACGDQGVEVLTLYSFSSENWKRPADEVDALMGLCVEYCAKEMESLREENIRVRTIGRRHDLPEEVQAALAALEERTTACTGPTLCLAINYGSRTEIVDAARSLARAAAAGEIDPDAIGERDIADRLYAPDLPDPDLFIRTGGSHRLSNFLLWQLSYAELVVTDTLWPDFDADGLAASIAEFSRRERRFGGLTSTRGVAPTHETR